MVLGVLLATLSLLMGDPDIPDPIDFQLPATSGGHIADDLWCSDGTPAIPALTCGVGVVTGLDAWECYDRTGKNVPVTPGSGIAYKQAPWGRALDTSSATGNTTTAGGAHPLGAWGSDHTLVVVANGDNSIVFTNKLGGGGGFYLWFTPTALQANYETSASVYQNVGVPKGTTGKWAVGTVRRTGSNYIVRYNGTQVSAAVTAVGANAASAPIYWGSYDSGSYKTPALALVLGFSCGLTDNSVAALESNWFGDLATDGRPVTTTRAGPAWVRDVTGTPHQIGTDAPAIEPVTPGPLATRNYLANSADLTQAPWGKTAGITVARVADVSAASGYVSRITATQSGAIYNLAADSTAAVKAVSAKIRLVSGTVVGLTDGWGAVTGSVQGVYGAWQIVKTTTASDAHRSWWLDIYGAGVFDVEWAQVEDGTVPTDYVPCGATACTRGTPGQGDVQARNHWRWNNNICKAQNIDGTGSCAWVNDPTWGAGGYATLTDASASIANGRYIQLDESLAGKTVTLTCELAAGTLTGARFYGWGATGGWGPATAYTLTSSPKLYSMTFSVSANAVPPHYFYVWPGAAVADTGTIKVGRCQLEPGDMFSGVWIDTADKPAERRSGGGLQSYGSVLEYILNNADIGTYSLSASVTRAAITGGWRITNGGAGYGGIIGGGISGLTGETWTATCEINGTSPVRLHAGANETYCTHTPVGAWQRVSCTKTLASNQPVGAYLYIAPGGTLDVRQCQLEKSAAPGRRCDAGASPTTCPGDYHTVSTAGWPVVSGTVRFKLHTGSVFPNPACVYSTIYTYVLDARNGAQGLLNIGVTSDGSFFGPGGHNLGTYTWTPYTDYDVSIRWENQPGNGIYYVTRNGVTAAPIIGPSMLTQHAPYATVGARNSNTGGNICASISDLEVRP